MINASGRMQLVEKARTLEDFPVPRLKLIEVLELSEIPSATNMGGVRGGVARFFETWEHTSGLTVTAYDSEHVGDFTIVGNTIDDILNAEPIDLEQFPTKLTGQNERQSFKGFYISSAKFTVFSTHGGEDK